MRFTLFVSPVLLIAWGGAQIQAEIRVGRAFDLPTMGIQTRGSFQRPNYFRLGVQHQGR